MHKNIRTKLTPEMEHARAIAIILGKYKCNNSKLMCIHRRYPFMTLNEDKRYPNSIFVSFRGTMKKSPMNLYHDLRFGSTDLLGMKIFSGISMYFHNIMQILDLLSKTYTSKRFIFSGFSLGGALAILSSIYMKNIHNIKYVGLVTLSAISPGNGVNEKLKNINYIYHEGMTFDPITKIFNKIRQGNKIDLNTVQEGIGHSIIHKEAKLLGLSVNKLRELYMHKINLND